MTLAQRRQMHSDHVESIEQVGAEAAALDLFFQVAIGGRQHARVYRHRFRGADGDHFTLHLPLLQHPQQFDLNRRRRLADFVEEERALIGRGEETGLVFHGTGEGALHVTEEFTLQQGLGERTAVDREKAVVRSRAQLVDVSRNHFLPRSRLAGDQHRGIRRGDRLGETQDIEPRLAAPDGTATGRAFAPLDLLLQRGVLHAQLAMLGGTTEDGQQLVVAKRLLDVVERALVHRLYGRL